MEKRKKGTCHGQESWMRPGTWGKKVSLCPQRIAMPRLNILRREGNHKPSRVRSMKGERRRYTGKKGNVAGAAIAPGVIQGKKKGAGLKIYSMK